MLYSRSWFSLAAAGSVVAGLLLPAVPAAEAASCVSPFRLATVDPATAASDLNELDAVTLLSPASGWAVGGVDDEANFDVGFTPLVERWEGTSWKLQRATDTSDRDDLLLGADADSPTDAWAVGARGNFIASTGQPLAEHWNGSKWSLVSTPALPDELGSQLRAVAALAPDDAWAVGAEGPAGTVATLIEHWDGQRWAVVRSPRVAGVLFAIDGTGPKDLWATGYVFDRVTGRIKTLAEHWNGYTWRILPTVTPLATSDPSEDYNVLSGVVAAGGQPWAVGTFGNPDLGVPYHTLVERWVQGRWVRVSAPSPEGSSLNGAAASSGGQLVAVGQIEHADATASPLVERWDGTQWARISVSGAGRLRGVAAETASGVAIAVGQTPAEPDRTGTYSLEICS